MYYWLEGQTESQMEKGGWNLFKVLRFSTVGIKNQSYPEFSVCFVRKADDKNTETACLGLQPQRPIHVSLRDVDERFRTELRVELA
jgi:hypothetical protein